MVKHSGQFLKAFIKTLPFWQHAYAAHKSNFIALVKEMQKATKVVQTLCSEGKCRKALPLATKVSASGWTPLQLQD